jgi:hypothetical protein
MDGRDRGDRGAPERRSAAGSSRSTRSPGVSSATAVRPPRRALDRPSASGSRLDGALLIADRGQSRIRRVDPGPGSSRPAPGPSPGAATASRRTRARCRGRSRSTSTRPTATSSSPTATSTPFGACRAPRTSSRASPGSRTAPARAGTAAPPPRPC